MSATPMRSALGFVASLEAAAALTACLAPREPAAPAVEIEIAEAEPPAPAPVAPPAAGRPSGEADAAPPPLPAAWTRPLDVELPFAASMLRARGLRDRLASTPLAGPDAGPTAAAVFAGAHARMGEASRAYAAAFHAEDATDADRIEAIVEAAEAALAWARRLDEAGLSRLPSSWRSDPAVALTFEDVAIGPVRRWRDEALTLAARCGSLARASGVVSDAARRCEGLGQAHRRLVARALGAPDAACGCPPGDPLCSALDGWCR